MAINPHITELDYNQVIPRTFDVDNDATRIVMATGVELEIALDEADGDSVATRGLFLSSNATIDADSSGVVVPEMNVEGYRELQIFSKSLVSLTGGTIRLIIEVSPVNTGDFWLETVNLVISDGNDYISSIDTNIASRARISVKTSAATAGSCQVFLTARG